MDKIKDLITQATKGAGIPDRIKNNSGGGLLTKLLISGRLLTPIVVILTNVNHYRAFGKQLIYIKGGILSDPDAPFGCRIEDDIDLEATDYPIGYILIALTATLQNMKPYILNGQIEELSSLWKTSIVKLSKGKKSLQLKDFIHLPHLEQLKC